MPNVQRYTLRQLAPSQHVFVPGRLSFGTPEQHVERIAELGMGAMALTEHGNVSSFAPFEKAARKIGIKPIFGLEAYTSPIKSKRKFHLTLLAADEEGFRNLMRIVSRSWAEGFYQYPTVSGEMLADHSEGIICLSGCADSLLACSLLGGKSIDKDLPEEESLWEWDGLTGPSYERAEAMAMAFRELFGDRYYLECQIFSELPRTCEINPAYQRMSQYLRIPLVATSDVHTLRPGDGEMRAVLHAAGRGHNTVAQQMSSWEYSVPADPPPSDKYVLDRLIGTGLSKGFAQEALENTAVIAERCNVTLPKASRFIYQGTRRELTW